jgi:hypothetical protein
MLKHQQKSRKTCSLPIVTVKIEKRQVAPARSGSGPGGSNNALKNDVHPYNTRNAVNKPSFTVITDFTFFISNSAKKLKCLK